MRFQEPPQHCHSRSYFIFVQEEGNTYPIFFGSVSQLPLNVKGLMPYKIYSWTLLYRNEVIISSGRVTTLEDGKLKHIFTHI
jgi:hypothetical protein